MGRNINQYFMYGISVPYNWHKEWEIETGKDFHDTFEDFTTEDINNNEIFCLFDGRDGKYIIIGKVLEKTDERQTFLGDDKPIVIPKMTMWDKDCVKRKVKKYFGLTGEFNFYFITHYR
jgi:hypothetical protein